MHVLYWTDVAIYITYTPQSASEQTDAFEVNNTNCGHTLPTLVVVYQNSYAIVLVLLMLPVVTQILKLREH
jgi:TPP-dependent pyruvate/acetoin dehydrogenase alpha subunit